MQIDRCLKPEVPYIPKSTTYDKTNNTTYTDSNTPEEKNNSIPGEKKLIKAIEKSGKDSFGPKTHIKYSIHEKTKEFSIKVIDDKTDTVLKEIPSEKLLDLAAYLYEKSGIFLDKKG